MNCNQSKDTKLYDLFQIEVSDNDISDDCDQSISDKWKVIKKCDVYTLVWYGFGYCTGSGYM